MSGKLWINHFKDRNSFTHEKLMSVPICLISFNIRSAIYSPAVSLQEERKSASHTILLRVRIYKKQIAFESNHDSTHGKILPL